MAGTFHCIELSLMVVAIIILKHDHYHKIYLETVWSGNRKRIFRRRNSVMDLKNIPQKIRTNLAVYFAKTNIKKEKNFVLVQPH